MPLYIGHSDNLINKSAAYGFVVDNPRDEQIATSHAMDLLQSSAEHLARRRGDRKYFWFVNVSDPRDAEQPMEARESSAESRGPLPRGAGRP
jgi:hypothetical protein